MDRFYCRDFCRDILAKRRVFLGSPYIFPVTKLCCQRRRGLDLLILECRMPYSKHGISTLTHFALAIQKQMTGFQAVGVLENASHPACKRSGCRPRPFMW
jgi:hypothetical protein